MGRVIHTNSPIKQRNQLRRTIVEMLHRLSHKGKIDEEAHDMAATIVFALVDIDVGVQSSATAWEKRGYWMKAERFMREWEWTKLIAANMDDVLRHEAWDLLPELMLQIMPHFNDIKVSKYMRKAAAWEGAYARLVAAEPLALPY
ncbi:MAG: hypothetical protein ACPG8W_05810 [Candidatus Promineifilaceae bacterium]